MSKDSASSFGDTLKRIAAFFVIEPYFANIQINKVLHDESYAQAV